MTLFLGFWLSLWREDFEAGSLPPGWEVLDGDSNGTQWEVWPSDTLYPDLPPGAGSWVLAYRDEIVGLPNFGTPGEEAITPAVYTEGYDSLLVRFGVAFREFYGKDTLLVYTLVFSGDTWALGDTLIFTAGDILPGLDTSFTLGPAESLRLAFRWWTPRWDHKYGRVAVDNVEILGFVPAGRDLTLLDAAPRGPVQGPFEPWVLVRNSGSAPAESLLLCLQISDSAGPVYADTFKAHLTLAPGESLRVPFPSWEPPEPGFYRLLFWNALEDEHPADDTLETEALAAPEVVRRITVSWGSVSVDGDPADWPEGAARWEVSDFLARDSADWGREAMALWDGEYLYLAIQAPPSETVLVALDDDASGSWAPDSSEGFNLITDEWLSAWLLDDYTRGDWAPSELESFARGSEWLELAIPIAEADTGPQFLRRGDSARVLIASWGGDTAAFWPQDADAIHKPGGFGLFIFETSGVKGGSPKPWQLWSAMGAVLGYGEGPLELYDPAGRLVLRAWVRGEFRIPLKRGVYLVRPEGARAQALLVY